MNNNNFVVNQMFDNSPVRDIPVIIVAAGPSLMKNCTELKRAEGKAIIVAVACVVNTVHSIWFSNYNVEIAIPQQESVTHPNSGVGMDSLLNDTLVIDSVVKD